MSSTEPAVSANTSAGTMPTLSPTMSFDEASRAVVAFLHERLPMGFWAVTRMENGNQTYLHIDDRAYGLETGGSHLFADSFCINMLADKGPRVAPDVAQVPVYRDSNVAQAVRIGAYAGVPITEADGSLFGTLCGLNMDPMDPAIIEEQSLLELLCQLLSMVLVADRGRDQAVRAAIAAKAAAETDPLTGLYTRHAWNEVIAAEEDRQRKYADPTVIAIVDLDLLKRINDEQGHAAGDAYIQAAGQALRDAAPTESPVARLGGDEFALLLRDTTAQNAHDVVEGLYRALADAGVAGSIGWAPDTVIEGFPGAMEAADERMYAAKRERRRAAVA